MNALSLLAACCLDLWFGDPRRWPHPVVAIGGLIRFLEERFYDRLSDQQVGGLLLVVLTLVGTGVAGWGFLAVADLVSPVLGGLASIWLAYTCLALRSLHLQSAAVVEALSAGDPDEARSLLSMIVGRDTAQLDESGILRACLETVAENTADGVIAPLCYLTLGGPVLGLLYKAVNTLDSMVGYRNERYRDFGRAAARLDDLANWLPARLTGGLMAIAAALLGMNGWQAWSVMRRDARRHASPNAGYPEAAAAGALGVQLGGPSRYFGKVVDKATLGDPDRVPDVALFNQMVYLMYATSALGLALLLVLRLFWA